MKSSAFWRPQGSENLMTQGYRAPQFYGPVEAASWPTYL